MSGPQQQIRPQGTTLYMLLAFCLLPFIVSACGQQTSQQPTATPQAAIPTSAVAESAATGVPPTIAPVSATATPLAAAATAAPTNAAAAGESFQNPVFRNDFPDPGILLVDGTYYGYATNGSGRNVQLARSTDLVKWQLLSDAMPALPRWARGGFTWAPEVIEIGGKYLLYYTVRDRKTDLQCIGVATSDKPEGKFKDTREGPLVCQEEEGGSIDASPFRDGEKLYLYWKNDGNCCGKPTYLYVQELAADGLELVAEPTRLVRNDQRWEGRLIEAPTMVKRDDDYYLFFSANDYGGFDYAVGYATCASATGPCEDAPENPILASLRDQNPPVVGPGHQTIVQVGDETWLFYHAWEVISSGQKGTRRFMWMDQVVWQDGKPDVLGPTTDPQPAPVGPDT